MLKHRYRYFTNYQIINVSLGNIPNKTLLIPLQQIVSSDIISFHGKILKTLVRFKVLIHCFLYFGHRERRIVTLVLKNDYDEILS